MIGLTQMKKNNLYLINNFSGDRLKLIVSMIGSISMRHKKNKKRFFNAKKNEQSGGNMERSQRNRC